MKPNWKDAPYWANYLAMDYDGEWSWFEKEPVLNGSREVWSPTSGRLETINWAVLPAETLEEKPVSIDIDVVTERQQMLEKALRHIVSVSPHCGDAMQGIAWDALEKLSLPSSDWIKY